MHPCDQAETIKELVKFQGATEASIKGIEGSIAEIRDNHLAHIYSDIKKIMAKMSSRRPSWSILWIITSLTSLVGILLTVILMKVVAR